MSNKHSTMTESSKPEAALPARFQNNSNAPFIAELKTITSDTKASDLSETQKQAFMAMMRMIHDPEEKWWTKRKEKLNRQRVARIQASIEKPPSETPRKQVFQKEGCRESLKIKIRKMRKERKFPQPPKQASREQARRYGFIPRSQRRNKLTDYFQN